MSNLSNQDLREVGLPLENPETETSNDVLEVPMGSPSNPQIHTSTGLLEPAVPPVPAEDTFPHPAQSETVSTFPKNQSQSLTQVPDNRCLVADCSQSPKI